MSDFDGVSGIGAPAKRALEAAGVRTVTDLARYTESEVKAWHGIGPNVMIALKKLMAAKAITFREE